MSKTGRPDTGREGRWSSKLTGTASAREIYYLSGLAASQAQAEQSWVGELCSTTLTCSW